MKMQRSSATASHCNASESDRSQSSGRFLTSSASRGLLPIRGRTYSVAHFGLFHDKFSDMREKLEAAERKQTALSLDNKSSIIGTIKPFDDAARTDSLDDGVHPEGVRTRPNLELEEMRCFLEFVESRILPIWSDFQLPTMSPRRTVRFEELQCLLKPGQLVYRQPNYQPQGHRQHSDMSPRPVHYGIWRVIEFQPASSFHDVPMDGRRPYVKPESVCTVYCLNYSDSKALVQYEDITFPLFVGEKPITHLECYPLAFHANHDSTLNSATTNGRRFKSHIYKSLEVRHLYYSGWALTIPGPSKMPSDRAYTVDCYPVYVESEIVIDFQEALLSHPNLQTVEWNQGELEPVSLDQWAMHVSPETATSLWKPLPIPTESGSTPRPTKWRSFLRTEYIFHQETRLYQSDAEQYSKCDKFISAPDVDRGWSAYEWTDDDLALLPRGILAYVIRQRRFVHVDIVNIDFDNMPRNVTLDNVQMKEKHRLLLRSAVSAHLNPPSSFSLDIIREKGKGLIVLLHGAPGVGKTATAEAIATEYGRPLFPITCGDLGTSPASVETTLRNIFRYAHLWQCILLLDEADVFVTQRERGGHNFEKNALVTGKSAGKLSVQS